MVRAGVSGGVGRMNSKVVRSCALVSMRYRGGGANWDLLAPYMEKRRHAFFCNWKIKTNLVGRECSRARSLTFKQMCCGYQM